MEKHRAENFVLNTTIAQEFNRGNAPPYVSNLDSESIHRESGFDDVVLTKDDEMIYKAKENQKQLGVIIPNPNLVTKLTEMGISREAAEISLISTKNDFSSALGCLTLTNGTSSEAHRNKQQSTNDVNIHAQIKQIVAMGFTESKAKLALSKSNNDTELAIEFLLSPS